MAVWQMDMPQFPAATAAEQQIKSYLIQMNNALAYALHNLDGENMTTAARAVINGGSSAAKEVAMSEADKQRLDALRAQLRRDILDKATEIAHDYQSLVEQTDQALRAEVSEGFIAKSGDVAAGNAAELLDLMSSMITQTSTSWTAQFTELSSAVDQTQTDLGNLSSETKSDLGALREETNAGLEKAGQQITENKNEFNQYVELTETYIRLSARGIEIGMLENNEQAPYSVLLGNEKLSFYQYGNEVAYFQYNKLYVTSAEFLDRFSVGSAANGGFFEFVTTPQGLGIKWRDA